MAREWIKCLINVDEQKKSHKELSRESGRTRVVALHPIKLSTAAFSLRSSGRLLRQLG